MQQGICSIAVSNINTKVEDSSIVMVKDKVNVDLIQNNINKNTIMALSSVAAKDPHNKKAKYYLLNYSKERL